MLNCSATLNTITDAMALSAQLRALDCEHNSIQLKFEYQIQKPHSAAKIHCGHWFFDAKIEEDAFLSNCVASVEMVMMAYCRASKHRVALAHAYTCTYVKREMQFRKQKPNLTHKMQKELLTISFHPYGEQQKKLNRQFNIHKHTHTRFARRLF